MLRSPRITPSTKFLRSVTAQVSLHPMSAPPCPWSLAYLLPMSPDTCVTHVPGLYLRLATPLSGGQQRLTDEHLPGISPALAGGPRGLLGGRGEARALAAAVRARARLLAPAVRALVR